MAQILATAAVIDGKFVRSLDQTGLAQKGGAVVSDLKIGTAPSQQAAKIGQGRCSLYLACDSLVGTDSNNLKVADQATTVAVVSTTEIPTGQMVVDTSTHFPELSTIRTAVDGATRRAIYLDPAGLSRELFDDEQYTNMLLVGAAYQTGVAADSRATRSKSDHAQRRRCRGERASIPAGRQAIADPDALAAAIKANRRVRFTPAPPSARAHRSPRPSRAAGVGTGADRRTTHR